MAQFGFAFMFQSKRILGQNYCLENNKIDLVFKEQFPTIERYVALRNLWKLLILLSLCHEASIFSISIHVKFGKITLFYISCHTQI